MLKITNLEKSYGDNIVFDKADLSIVSGERVALLGQNGTGKTTLFRCIVGEEFFDGEIQTDGSVAMMEQEKTFDTLHVTFADYLAEKQARINKKIADLEQQMGLPEVYEHERKYMQVLQEHERLCSRTTESKELDKQKSILNSLGYHESILSKPIASLSGGQKTALRLTECLSKDADILLLDEPTNHLDVDSIAWLERTLVESNKTILIISHDRFFLDSFVTAVVEIENQLFVRYATNYSQYLVQRVAHRELLQRHHDATKAKKERLLESSREKREWASKSGSQKMRVLADRLEREADELPNIPDPREFEKLYSFTCKSGERSSMNVFETKNLKKSFDRVVFDEVSVAILRGERVAIVGENGCGKTTLLKVLTKQLDVDSGDLHVGSNLKIGYFDQEGKNLPGEKKVMDYFFTVNDRLTDYQIASLAKKFGLSHDLPKKKISSLSGGEKARLQLMALLSGGYNVLALDEPTNHLDLELRESLERALNEFEGTILFVSHDRFFINKVATNILSIENDIVRKLHGNYSDNF